MMGISDDGKQAMLKDGTESSSTVGDCYIDLFETEGSNGGCFLKV